MIDNLIHKKKYLEALIFCEKNGMDECLVKNEVEKQMKKANEAYQNGNYENSMTIFKDLIGVSEPSLIVAKFYKQEHHHLLIDYLIELHKQGFSNKKHTKLLFNLFSQNQNHGYLQNFISMLNETKKSEKGENVRKSNPGFFGNHSSQSKKDLNEYNKFLQNFDITVAIDILNKNGLNNEANALSKIVGISFSSISSLIKQKKYSEAASQIFDHFDQPIGYKMLMEFGPTLLKSDINSGKIVEQTATLMWKIQNNQNVDSDFIKLFWGYPQICYSFLKSIIHENPTELFADTLVSLVIPKIRPDPSSFFGNPILAKSSGEEALSLISDKSLPINCYHLLSVCAESGFLIGVAELLSRIGRPSDGFSFLLKEDAPSDIIINWVFNLKPKLSSDDWVKLFLLYSSEDGWQKLPENSRINIMQKIISNINGAISLSKIMTILLQNKSIPIDVIKNEPTKLFKELQHDFNNATKNKNDANDVISKLDEQIQKLENNNIEFKPKICDECGEPLQFPYVAFFCGHCVHSKCSVKDENGKPICQICFSQNLPNSRRVTANDLFDCY